MDVETPVLEARELSRSFGPVRALEKVNFAVRRGEVVALIGDNGAGKSTLVKALSGTLSLDSGEIFVSGQKVILDSPTTASNLGIETVYQDLALAPHLSAVQNMFLGREVLRPGFGGRLGFMDASDMRKQAVQAFADLGGTIRSLSDPVGTMSGGQRQQIAIARAVHWADGVVFLDEPTAALGVVQTQNVLDTIRRVCKKGVGVVFISHSMPHVMAVADRIYVLRLGRNVGVYDAQGTTMEQLVGAMTGAFEGASGA
jgi:simple sugar transport system ATP-binding protein